MQAGTSAIPHGRDDVVGVRLGPDARLNRTHRYALQVAAEVEECMDVVQQMGRRQALAAGTN